MYVIKYGKVGLPLSLTSAGRNTNCDVCMYMHSLLVLHDLAIEVGNCRDWLRFNFAYRQPFIYTQRPIVTDLLQNWLDFI